jgi:hypothetical protein
MSYQTAISGLDWQMVPSGMSIPAQGIAVMQLYEQGMGAIVAGNNVGVIMVNVASANYVGTISDIVYDAIVISGTINTNRTVTLYFDGSLNGNKRYTVLNNVVAVSGGLYTVTLTTGLGTSVALTVPASPSATSMISIYVDTLGNVVAGGDIVSSGSNSNGSWVQFADGTMEAWFFAFITYFQNVASTSGTWTFPVPFVSAPTCFGNRELTAIYNGGSLRGYFPSTTVVGGEASVTQVQEQSTGADNCMFVAGDYVFSNIRAIGRWK